MSERERGGVALTIDEQLPKKLIALKTDQKGRCKKFKRLTVI